MKQIFQPRPKSVVSVCKKNLKLLHILGWTEFVCIILCYQHNDDVGVCVVPQLPQPALDVLVGEVLRDVVHQQRTHCASVVPARKKGSLQCRKIGGDWKGGNLRRSDGSITLLASCVPDLGLNCLPVNLQEIVDSDNFSPCKSNFKTFLIPGWIWWQTRLQW